jgi:soluble lytic murein transglycosylase-like protein
MKWKAISSIVVSLSLSAAATAAVRIVVKDGKKVIYNDGIGETRVGSAWASDDWLRARIAIPSLFDDLIADAAGRHSLDPKLIKSVMLVESAFNPAAVSPKGARGLMQLMPSTAARYGVRSIHDPLENISGGARYLADLITLFGGNLEKSLAAYNAGEGAVFRYGGVPPFDETRLYVHKTLTAYYGKSALGGGFGKPATETFRPAPPPARGKPVRLLRDAKNRVLLTTDRSASRRISRRLS